MNQEKSSEYARAEAKVAAVIFAAFAIWCPTYLAVVRPFLNSLIAPYISRYPAILHLVPILAPIILLALVLARTLPPKNTEPR